MIVQEKEPLSPLKGFKVTTKWSSRKPSKQEEIVVGHGLTTIFLYTVHRPDGLPLGSNRHQSVKFCYRNCYTNRGVAICVAVTAK